MKSKRASEDMLTTDRDELQVNSHHHHHQQQQQQQWLEIETESFIEPTTYKQHQTTVAISARFVRGFGEVEPHIEATPSSAKFQPSLGRGSPPPAS